MQNSEFRLALGRRAFLRTPRQACLTPQVHAGKSTSAPISRRSSACTSQLCMARIARMIFVIDPSSSDAQMARLALSSAIRFQASVHRRPAARSAGHRRGRQPGRGEGWFVEARLRAMRGDRPARGTGDACTGCRICAAFSLDLRSAATIRRGSGSDRPNSDGDCGQHEERHGDMRSRADIVCILHSAF